MQAIVPVVYANQLFQNKAGQGDASVVSKAIIQTIQDLLPNAINKPIGSDIDAVIPPDAAAKFNKALSTVKKIWDPQTAGSISIVLCGEAHDDASDQERAKTFITEMGNGGLTPSLVIFERGMSYSTQVINCDKAIETDMTTSTLRAPSVDFGLGLSGEERDMVIAAYILLCVAGGNQNDIDKVFVFFGENHKAILKWFDYYARHSAADWVQKRNRNLLTIRSSVQ
jgi:hypothetical protein